MKYYHSDATFRYSMPSTKLLVLGIVTAISGMGVMGIIFLLQRITGGQTLDMAWLNPVFQFLHTVAGIALIIGIFCISFAPLIFFTISDAGRIRYSVRKGLFCYQYGNPLHLKDHERLPEIRCRKQRDGLFELTISATSSSVEDIMKLSSQISSMLNKKYRRYAVTRTVPDLSYNSVAFYIEDVTVDNSLTFRDVSELRPKGPTELRIDRINSISLQYSQSILVAGKTRSGKTTAVISLLLQALLMGRDSYGSRILIIDPKQAELSRLPHAVTLDEDGGARAVLQAMGEFADTISRRQKVLNELSGEEGNAVQWWNAGMHPSFVFIDEYVALRSLFPKRSSKDEPDYCQASFDSLLKRIVTMGASSGSFAIISIAEASVDESGGGIPAMVRSACSTKILFRPTLPEARLLWNSEMLEGFSSGRIYKAGDAWFSSTDGIHDMPAYVHFPVMEFGEYRELGRLLEQYYAK